MHTFVFFFAIIFAIYHFIISFYRIKNMISVFKNNKEIFEIRNSPLDRFATLAAKAIWCLKGACESAQPVGVTVGMMLTTDQILTLANKEPIFAPYIVTLMHTFFPGTREESLTQFFYKNGKLLDKNNQEIKEVDTIIDSFKTIMPTNGGLNVEESSELMQCIKEHREELINNRDDIKQKIIERINKK